MRSIQFEITIEAEKYTGLWVIPAEIYKSIMEESAPVANYTNELMASRFSDVMWLIEQIMWQSLDKRVAAFLLEEASIEGTSELKITHETIANHLGTHREVITRMLRYFQNEEMVRLSRGTVTILNEEKLNALREAYLPRSSNKAWQFFVFISAGALTYPYRRRKLFLSAHGRL